MIKNPASQPRPIRSQVAGFYQNKSFLFVKSNKRIEDCPYSSRFEIITHCRRV